MNSPHYRGLRATRALWAPFAALLVSACAGLPGAQEAAPPAPPLADIAATAWQAPLPHNGQRADLRSWWLQQGDAVQVELIEAAQNVNPSLAVAASRIAQARANARSTQAGSGPTLDASAAASRAQTASFPVPPPATTVQAGLMAGWEIDLFGANRAANNAAAERLASAQAGWHDARVSVAAEVANQYIAFRACAVQLALTRQDAASKAESARLTGITTRAGFTATGQQALSEASAADAATQSVSVAAQCESAVKALVALTGIPEAALKQKLASTPAANANAAEAPVALASVPAQALNQRPDLFAAQRDIAAASYDLTNSQAQQYPRLSLSGSIGLINASTGGVSSDLTTWSIGPLALSLPLYDGGRRAANVDAAKARYDEATAVYKGRVRAAVREVEDALVNLQATADRAAPTEAAAKAWRAALLATETRQKNGFASLMEVEETRRMAMAADISRLALQRDRQLAWVALYRAVGGGWERPEKQP
jgi:NodT family efflux transporter outer membrane factor (OMF) lipoprotein